MVLKEEKGITIVSLVIMVIILLILAGVSVNIGGSVITSAKLQSINTNMLLIQAKTKAIYEQSTFNKDESLLKGQKLEELMENQTILKLINDGVISAEDKLYLLSQENLDELGLYNIDIEDGYMVNYETEEIVYLKGFKVKDTTYYKLSDTEGLSIRSVEE